MYLSKRGRGAGQSLVLANFGGVESRGERVAGILDKQRAHSHGGGAYTQITRAGDAVQICV